MTIHIADIASYQAGITSAQLWVAGIDGINVKTSHGVGQRTVHARADQYVREARAAGKKLSCFHWLTGDASGVAQADYAYRQMALLGLNVPGVVVVVDIEATSGSVGGIPDVSIYHDYIERMRALLGRPIVTYTGDWWQETHGWLVASADRSPWLWAAPNDGYQAAYPGDTSPLWDAGYGGWAELAVMQYRVSPIAGIDVSQSAVRSDDIWADMTGVPRMAWERTPAAVSLRNEFNAAFPNRDKASDGSIGDSEHSTRSSDHNPDETGATPYEDSDTINEVHAEDVDSDLKRPGWTLFRCFEIIRKRAAAGTEVRVQNMICDGQITSRSWGFSEWRDYTGSDPHDTHGHVSLRYGSGAAPGNPEKITSPWGILAAVQGEDDMNAAEMTAWAKSAEGKAALGAALADAPMPAPAGSTDADGKWLFRTYVTNTYGAGINARNYSAEGRTASQATLVKVTQDDPDKAEILAAIAASATVDVNALAQAILAGLPAGTLTGDEVQARTEEAIRNVLGGLG